MDTEYTGMLTPHILDKMTCKRKISLSGITVTLIIVTAALLFVMPYGKERMATLLTRAEQMNSGYIPMDTVTFMDEVLGFYDSHGTAEERIRANYMKGCVLRDKGDSPTAMEYYMKAVSLADTADQTCNFELLGRIYAQMAELFHKQRYPQKELEMWNNAISMAKKAQDTLMVMQSMMRISGVYWLEDNKGKSAAISRETYKFCKAMGADSLAARELVTTIAYNLEQNNLDDVKREMDEYVSKSGLADEHGNIAKGCEFFYYYSGQYYRKSCNIDSALYYYRKLISYDRDIMNLENGYKGLMEVYGDMQQSDSVIKYAKLYANANDTANIRNSANEVSRVQALYDYSSYQQKALENSTKVIRLWCILFFCMVTVVIIIFTASFLYRQYKTRMLAEMSELNGKYMETLIKYNEIVAEYSRENSGKSAIEDRMKCQIDNLKKALSSYQDGFDADKMTLEQNLQNHQIVIIMHAYASKATLPAAAEWSTLMTVAARYLPEFFSSLADKHVALTSDEKRLCVLTRLGFIPSEIAVLMNMTKQRVSNIRSRLNKILFKDTETKNFTDHISKI